jgi:hypothetical protein
MQKITPKKKKRKNPKSQKMKIQMIKIKRRKMKNKGTSNQLQPSLLFKKLIKLLKRKRRSGD